MTFVAPPGYQPVYKPLIPYTGPIYGGLRAGMSIYLQGTVHESVTRFFLNLQCGPQDGCDIAFHINPRFDGWDKVVFNSFQSGSWEGEEKIRDMPFCKGKTFEMVILVNTEGYKVHVNGKEFYVFKHRLPLERVCALNVGGDISIQTINIIGGSPGGMGGMGGGYPGGGMSGGVPGGYPGGGMSGGVPGGYPGGGMSGGVPGGYPGGGMEVGYPGGGGGTWGGCCPGANLPGMGDQPVYNPTIPYSTMIPGGLSSKRTIIIRGIVSFGAQKFCVNFKVGGSHDIAFHLNPRMREGTVVRNSHIRGTWGQEERELNFNPFQEGQYFDISIRCGNQRFKVFVNGQHMCDFLHRFQPFTQIDMLEVEGDVQISYIHI